MVSSVVLVANDFLQLEGATILPREYGLLCFAQLAPQVDVGLRHRELIDVWVRDISGLSVEVVEAPHDLLVELFLGGEDSVSEPVHEVDLIFDLKDEVSVSSFWDALLRSATGVRLVGLGRGSMLG